MQAREFWNAVTLDESNVLERFLGILESHAIQFRLIGGQVVSAYVDPVVSLDLDVVVASGDLERLEGVIEQEFDLERFPHSLNLTAPNSELRIRVQRDPRFAAFVERAVQRTVLDHGLPVAALEDVLQGKVWAVQDPSRRGSQRQKDLADIARILETYPALRPRVPPDVLQRLF